MSGKGKKKKKIVLPPSAVSEQQNAANKTLLGELSSFLHEGQAHQNQQSDASASSTTSQQQTPPNSPKVIHAAAVSAPPKQASNRPSPVQTTQHHGLVTQGSSPDTQAKASPTTPAAIQTTSDIPNNTLYDAMIASITDELIEQFSMFGLLKQQLEAERLRTDRRLSCDQVIQMWLNSSLPPANQKTVSSACFNKKSFLLAQCKDNPQQRIVPQQIAQTIQTVLFQFKVNKNSVMSRLQGKINQLSQDSGSKASDKAISLGKLHNQVVAASSYNERLKSIRDWRQGHAATIEQHRFISSSHRTDSAELVDQLWLQATRPDPQEKNYGRKKSQFSWL